MYGPARRVAAGLVLVVLVALAACATVTSGAISPRPAPARGPRCQREHIPVARSDHTAASTAGHPAARYYLAA